MHERHWSLWKAEFARRNDCAQLLSDAGQAGIDLRRFVSETITDYLKAQSDKKMRRLLEENNIGNMWEAVERALRLELHRVQTTTEECLE